MIIDELAPGAVIKFGHLSSSVQPPEIDLKWIKVSHDNKFLCTNLLRVQVDAIEHSRPDGDRRHDHGSNCFPHTNLFQWLNAKGSTDWWTKATEYDELAIWYRGRPGFCTSFVPYELDMMVPYVIRDIVPKGMIRDYGKTIESECLVSIPSAKELGWSDADSKDDGDIFFRPGNQQFAHILGDQSFTRSPTSGIGFYTISHDCYLPEERSFIHPVIKLKPDGKVVDFHDPDGSRVYLVVDDDGHSDAIDMSEFEQILVE